MAAASLIATGTTAATSSDIVVSTTPVLIALKGVAGGQPYIEVQLKDDAAAYNPIGGLSKGSPSMALTIAGTYRLSRPAGDACGAFSG